MHVEITLDVNDPERMLQFWAALLGYEQQEVDRFADHDRTYWALVDPVGRGPRMVIQRVPEPVTAKARLHLDLHVARIEEDAQRAESLGALRLDQDPIHEVGATWIRLTDPEGNVFCLVQAEGDRDRDEHSDSAV